MLTREEWFDISVNLVPLVMITGFVTLLLLFNPWGWEDLFLISTSVVLHVVPIVTLAPVSYLLVKVFVEASEHGTSETAARILRLFSLEGENAGQKHEMRAGETETETRKRL